ncbi:TPR-like protein [Hesseltinella vesiculosa]|uniref:TPR-like protein n=1 Tax=Hesseltinella vesiculosa TaxID=101127 RepID=A0A1X2GK15_9FUNG|nr:TPR-like protein [Hesseltinella vesiculosa]
MSNNQVNVQTPAPGSQDNIKKFFEDRDWKFYAAVAAGVTLAGAGAYYLTQSSPPKKKASKKAKKTKETPETSPSAPAPAEKQQETPAATDAVDLTALSDSDIEQLTSEERAKVAQGLKEKGNKLFSGKKYKEAIDAYSQAIRFKKDPIYFSNRAACHSFMGNHKQVISDSNDALLLDPTYIKAINRRAQAFEKENQLEEALYDFSCVCILDGFKNDNAGKSMERLLQQIATTRAAEIMENKPHRLPSTAYVNAYFDSFRPANIDVPTTTDETTGDFFFAKAFNATVAKDYETAAQAIDKAIELGCSPACQAYALNLKGTFVFLMGDSQGALDYLNKAIEADPKYVQSYIKRSSIYIEQQDIGSAFKDFETAISVNPNDPDVFYHRGQIRYISGDYESAANDYSESVDLDDTFVFAHVQLGVVQYKMGSISKSMTTFNNTLQKFPNSADVHNYYGELLADQQKFAEAVDMFSKAIELDTKNPIPYINKAMLKHQAFKEADEAISLCKTAFEADPACDAAVASLGQLYLERGEPEQALTYYNLAIDLARTQPELEHAISYVEATKTQIKFSKDFPEAAAKLRSLRQ